MQLIVITQYRENYGYRWKNKGGEQYVTQVENLDALQESADEVIKEVEYDNDMATNHVIDWFVMGDSEPFPGEWYDVTRMTKADGKWLNASPTPATNTQRDSHAVPQAQSAAELRQPDPHRADPDLDGSWQVAIESDEADDLLQHRDQPVLQGLTRHALLL